MDSRKTFILVAIALAALLAGFAIISIVTDNAGFILWAFAPIAMALATVVAALRGATKGGRKRARDERIAAQRVQNRGAARTAASN